MSVLYLGSDPATLADRLADSLERPSPNHDFFTPTAIVVPNRFVRKWLRLYLARKHSVAINLQFNYLEQALWQLLQAVDPAGERSPPRETDENVYRLMVLSVLLESKDADLAPFTAICNWSAARSPGSPAAGRGTWPTASACCCAITNTPGKMP